MAQIRCDQTVTYAAIIVVCSEMRQPFENLVTATQQDLNRLGQDITEPDRWQSAEIDTAPKEVRADILPCPELKNFTNRPGRIPSVTCEIRLTRQPVTCRQINVEASASTRR